MDTVNENIAYWFGGRDYKGVDEISMALRQFQQSKERIIIPKEASLFLEFTIASFIMTPYISVHRNLIFGYLGPDTSIQPARDIILEGANRSYRLFAGLNRTPKELSMYTERIVCWCLKYQKELPGINSCDQLGLWWRLRFIFGLEDLPNETGYDSEDVDEDVYEVACGGNGPDDHLEPQTSVYGDETQDIPADTSYLEELLELDQQIVSMQDEPRPTIDPKNLNVRLLKNFEKGQRTQIQTTPLPTLGVVDYERVLDHILSTAKEIHHVENLIQDLGKPRIKEILQNGLDPAVKLMCGRGVFDYASIKEAHECAENPVESTQAGVYMHTLSPHTNPEIFWLYVGQSIRLNERIRKHKTRRYQSSHFCLHYFVWNYTEQKQKMQSVFSTLFTLKPEDASLLSHDQQRLILSLAEMWSCCIFQTLTTTHLNKYLPADVEKPWAGRHLNVGLPLYQSFSPERTSSQNRPLGDREMFTKFLTSQDLHVRKWAKSLRDAFNNLRESPDPALREYYRRQISISLSKARDAQQHRVLKEMRTFLTSGRECKITYRRKQAETAEEPTMLFNCGQFWFSVHRSFGLRLREEDRIFVKFWLSDAPNPNRYVLNATDEDPASRLAISISGQSKGQSFSVWLKTKYNNNLKRVKKMNTLVDMLEGVSFNERRAMNLPRRWYTKDLKHYYT